jgi:hypothetical protein
MQQYREPQSLQFGSVSYKQCSCQHLCTMCDLTIWRCRPGQWYHQLLLTDAHIIRAN